MENNLQIELLPKDLTIQSNLVFKVIIIGNSGVGKSSLTTKAVNDIFINDYSTTVNFEFFSFNLKINEEIIKLQIWDTCGQEAFRSMIANYYRNCSLAIIVYSIDDIESFESIDGWVKELKIHSSPDVKIFLIGTKNDLKENRKVKREDGEKYITDYQIDLFMEVSAKTGFNAKEVFIEAGKMLYQDHIQYNLKQETMRRASSLDSQVKNIIFPSDNNQRNSKKCTC